ncbi:lipid phosphate phosphatase epsilon 2, chloroplastic-like [Chenopodium quinoa]|uniref:lipid phosphate phosphatase epsilon 2, chloroplastic-like n=1 Tax=Chenopodium quinoa TaxID=63459 RepID=UPI000B77D8DC|nr:lipid phosphate phosphatase epsilon 2, chloroplastic-like [Chenopodium quinoa]
MSTLQRKKEKRRIMGEKFIEIPTLKLEHVEKNINVLEHEVSLDGSSKFHSFLFSPEFESTLNRLSKWAITVIFAAVFIWRRDAEAAWVTIGSVVNSLLCIALKRILNQDRPIGNTKSDPGMPSCHGQYIFYAVIYFILSMFQWLGVNEITVIVAVVILAIGSYLSWLRVLQRFHTMNQVLVGAAFGSCFSLAWLWAWNAIVSEAFNSNLWVQVSILVAFAMCCLAFQLYVILKSVKWFRKDP